MYAEPVHHRMYPSVRRGDECNDDGFFVEDDKGVSKDSVSKPFRVRGIDGLHAIPWYLLESKGLKLVLRKHSIQRLLLCTAARICAARAYGKLNLTLLIANKNTDSFIADPVS